MTILPINPAANATPAALLEFLEQCRALAVAINRPRLVSITLEVPALDPLAVLESIFEPNERHFYVERPAENFALAGAEAVLSFTARGPQRFADCQRFIDATLADAIVVGDQTAAFSGPHFFTAYTFSDDTEPNEPFESASLFIPRWQVALANGRTTAVANFVMPPAPQADLRPLAEKVLHAHQKFARFDYDTPTPASDQSVRSVQSDKPSPLPATPESTTYRASVTRALDYISRGAFQKIVLARALDFTTPDATEPFHPLRVLNTLRERFTDCYSFSLANGRGQSFIGASPERLLRVRDRRLLTEALAGSAPRGASASEDAALGGALLNSEKDLREQRHVLDSILRRLEPLGLALTHPARPGLRKLANVQHLHTPVEATLPEDTSPHPVRLLDTLARLHPTPAVGGTPREAAIAHIRELENFPRGLYAGAIGWLDSRGNGEFFVGLRSALIDGANARLYAGAGIVTGSSPDREFDETEIKFRAIRDALLT